MRSCAVLFLAVFSTFQISLAFKPALPGSRSHCKIDEENRDIAPVCGGQSKITYGNSFLLKCQSRFPSEKFTEGPCEEIYEFNPCIYAWTYEKKVCGADNKTYNNIWDLKCSSKAQQQEIDIKNEGVCLCENFNVFYRPVCVSSGMTYPNEEAVECYNFKNAANIYSPRVGIVHEGECYDQLFRSGNPCKGGCFGEKVCASNGITYNSVEEARCLLPQNPGLRILHSGECKLDETLAAAELYDDPCPVAMLRPMSNPLCGSDNKTYENPFIFVCQKKNNIDDQLTLLKKGRCEEEAEEDADHTFCPYSNVGVGYSAKPSVAKRTSMPHIPYGSSNYTGPVCGSDGVTYTNGEELCKAAQKQNNRIYLVRSSQCTEEDDPCWKLKHGNEWFPQPMCGNDRKTYANPSSLWCAVKSNEGLEILHEGKCLEESQ